MAGTHPDSPERRLDDLSWATVLVVDDHAPNVALLEQLLGRMGVGRVAGITDPRRTIECYRALDPDLIMLDLHMPGLDGLAVLGALGAVIPVDSFTPVLVLTADVAEEAKAACLSGGAKDFLTKPFDRTEVTLRTRNLLQTRALHLAVQAQKAALQAELDERARQDQRRAEEREGRYRRIAAMLEPAAIQMVFQPIVELTSGQIVGIEALARFPGSPARPPDEWFAEAAGVGMGDELELAAIRGALAQARRLPESVYLSLNASPSVVLDPRLGDLLAPAAGHVVIELTEHTAVTDYEGLLRALEGLRGRGARLAVDDAGAGYAGLRHILRVQPDIIKLDIGLTGQIHLDPARRALASALVSFAAETGATIVAEGIELPEEMDVLRSLGVPYGQGFYLARPGPLLAFGTRLRAVA